LELAISPFSYSFFKGASSVTNKASRTSFDFTGAHSYTSIVKCGHLFYMSRMLESGKHGAQMIFFGM